VKAPTLDLERPTKWQRSSTNATPFGENRYQKYRLNRESILLNAPEASGVYGLLNAIWIYIGEAENIRAHLLGHLADNNPCVNHYQPSGFAFELVSPEHRFHRQQQLAQELQPMCKGRAFAYKMNS
jgi:hypothetical protein